MFTHYLMNIVSKISQNLTRAVLPGTHISADLHATMDSRSMLCLAKLLMAYHYYAEHACMCLFLHRNKIVVHAVVL